MTSWRARTLSLALALSCVGLVHDARSDEPAPPGSTAADVLFREGKALLDAGKLADACRVLEESNRLEPAGGTLLNLASCYERLGRYASAEKALSQASRLAEAAGREDAKRFVDGRLAAVAPNVSVLVLKLSSRRPLDKTVVEVDKVQVEGVALSTEVRVDPGEHEIRVETTGSPPWRKTVTLDGAGKRLDVDVEEAIAPERAPPVITKEPPPAPSSATNTLQIVGIVGLAAGGALLAGGAIAGGLAIDAWTEAEDRCPNPTCTDPIGVVRAEDAATFGYVSTALIVSGAVFAVAGGVLEIVAEVSQKKPKAGSVRFHASGIRF